MADFHEIWPKHRARRDHPTIMVYILISHHHVYEYDGRTNF
jgi:hypothetical protein